MKYVVQLLSVFGGIIVILLAFVAFDNARSGCYPWSPKEVAFHQGMTLCPGQSATIHIQAGTYGETSHAIGHDRP